MRIRRTESVGDNAVEVMIEDWPRDGESEEVFEERIVRLADRLTVLDFPKEQSDAEGAEKTEGE